MLRKLALIFFALIPIFVFSHFDARGNCAAFDAVFFDPKEETLFLPLGSGIVGASLWEPFVRHREKIFFFKKESSRSLREAREWEGITLFFVDPHESRLCDDFHFLQHLLGIWDFRGCEERDRVRHIIFCAKDSVDHDCCDCQSKFIKTAIKALFPNAKVHTLKSLKKKKHSKIFFERVLFSSRFFSVDGAFSFSIATERLDRFRNLFFSHCHALIEPCGRCPRITVLVHGHPRCLNKKTQDRLIRALSDSAGCSVSVIDMDRIEFDDFLRVMANTDILLSVHGRGLCHIPFLPKHAAIIEFFPPDCFHSDFFLLSRACGLEFWANTGHAWITPDRPPSCGTFGNVFQEVEPIDIDTTLSIIQGKIERLGCN